MEYSMILVQVLVIAVLAADGEDAAKCRTAQLRENMGQVLVALFIHHLLSFRSILIKMYLLVYLTGAYIYYTCFFLFCQKVLRRGSSIKAKRLQRERVSLHVG
ncbi:hypothetical protein LI328DRAFT_12091 [Trichoderma asperelloides]|nr:hypothetical protein LI328DRAFT_12091 [Trichoderma asperelloides]